jgi:histidinol dehydrogenase
MYKNDELRIQTSELDLSLDEMKDRLVSKIKTETDDIKNFEKRAKDLKKLIDT